ncbi:MAG: helix-turn-helix domain-containing protein [Pirellulales bacterium]|nr:helix-turn-helix domain-containing protein [Pirellulales bacterium]
MRQKLDVLWLLHHGLKQAAVCQITGVSRKTVDRYLTLWEAGGLEAVYENKHYHPTSALETHREKLKAEFQAHPPRTVAEAASRILDAEQARLRPEQTAGPYGFAGSMESPLPAN